VSVTGRRNPWAVHEVDPAVAERIAAAHVPDPDALRMGVDIVGDPHREDNEGFNWTRLRCTRNIADVIPGSTVVMGSSIGRYLAKVIAWDFEVSDDDPIVTLELLPVTPDSIERALARCRPPKA